MTWQPIETAPKADRWTLIDLWIVHPNGRQWRVPNCTYDPKNDSWVGPDRQWVQGRRFRDNEGVERFDPADKSAEASRATHWMLPPAAPMHDQQPNEAKR